MKKKIEYYSQPDTTCSICKGSGELLSGYWTYKKCLGCNGSGKNNYNCISCGELLAGVSLGWTCTNKVCERRGLLSFKKD